MREGVAKMSNSINALSNALQILIENTIRKVLDEKLSQILSAQETITINENLAIRVGDSVFKGKLTKVNKTKK